MSLKLKIWMCFLAVCIAPFNASGKMTESVDVRIKRAAAELSRRIDSRLAEMGSTRSDLFLIMTTPVNLNDMSHSSPLARLAGEEMTYALVNKGFRVSEIRRTADVLVSPGEGEFVLSRDAGKLWKDKAPVSAFVAGTYSILRHAVLFHFRVISASDNSVLAMSKLSVPLDSSTYDLLSPEEQADAAAVRPTVSTVP